MLDIKAGSQTADKAELGGTCTWHEWFLPPFKVDDCSIDLWLGYKHSSRQLVSHLNITNALRHDRKAAPMWVVGSSDNSFRNLLLEHQSH